MTSQMGHRGGVSQLYLSQGLAKIKAAEKKVLSALLVLLILGGSFWETLLPRWLAWVVALSVLIGSLTFNEWIPGVHNHSAGRNLSRALFQVASRNQLLFVFLMAFLPAFAHGEDQPGVCKLMGLVVIWEVLDNPERMGLSPWPSTLQSPVDRMNMCIPHVRMNFGNPSPDPFWTPSLSRVNVKAVVMIWVAIGGLGLAGRMLCKRRRAFTEADIDRGLMGEPAVPKRSILAFDIPPSIV